MNDKLLSQFYSDEFTREEVIKFITRQLDKFALEAVYRGEDTKEIATAKQVIDKAFMELGEQFGRLKEPDLTNQSR